MENGTDDREREEKEQEREVIDFYQVGKNIFVMIYREGSRIFYRPIEPELSEKELEALSAVKDYVMKRLYFTHRDLRERWTKLQQDVEEKVKEANDVLLLKLDSPSLSKISYYVKRDYLGYERIDVLMNDPFIEDISSSGPGIPIYVYHIKYGWLPTTVIFPSEESYTAFIRRLAYRAGQDLVFATPIVEGPLPPKNYRAHLVLDVISRSGSSFTIRRGAEVPLSIVRLIILRTLSPRMAAYIWLLISHMRTILIAGPMASGKTTLLNAIIMFIPPAKKIVSIEETNELRLDRENWVPLIVRPSTSPGISNITLYELLKSSLRQRPDYIVVGEVRGEEAYTFFQAISLGHGGLGTIHAESFQQIIRRLESQPLNIPRSMIPLVNTMIFMKSIYKEGGIVRKVSDVIDIVSYDPSTDSINASSSFHYDLERDEWIEAEILPGLNKISELTGLSVSELKNELARRERFLSTLAAKGIDLPDEVSRAIEEYSLNPERAIEMFEGVKEE